MATFDPYLRQVARWVEQARGGPAEVREFEAAGDPAEILAGLPVRTGPDTGSGVILRADTFVELGSPRAGSCAFALCSNDPSLVRDGRITLVGPSIRDSAGASLPFGQVLLIGGEALGDADHALLDRIQYESGQIDGYMIRSTPGRLWSRVSTEAVRKGFDFEVLGRALVGIFKLRVPRIRAMEVVFVTSAREDLGPLDEIATQVGTIGRHIERESWRARGIDIECTLGVDCKACDDKPACDEIRDVVRIRKRRADA